MDLLRSPRNQKSIKKNTLDEGGSSSRQKNEKKVKTNVEVAHAEEVEDEEESFDAELERVTDAEAPPKAPPETPLLTPPETPLQAEIRQATPHDTSRDAARKANYTEAPSSSDVRVEELPVIREKKPNQEKSSVREKKPVQEEAHNQTYPKEFIDDAVEVNVYYGTVEETTGKKSNIYLSSEEENNFEEENKIVETLQVSNRNEEIEVKEIKKLKNEENNSEKMIVNMKEDSESELEDEAGAEDQDEKLQNLSEKEKDEKEIAEKAIVLNRKMLENNVTEALKYHDLKNLRSSVAKLGAYLLELDESRTDGNETDDEDGAKFLETNQFYPSGIEMLRKIDYYLRLIAACQSEKECRTAIENIKKKKEIFKFIENEKIVKKHLAKLPQKKWELPVLSLNRKTFAEVSSYVNPNPIVQRVLQSAFLLLENPEAKTQDWRECRTLCKMYSHGQLANPLTHFSVENLHPYLVARSEQLLASYEKGGVLTTLDYKDVKNTSPGAATFYIWAKDIINRYKLLYDDDKIPKKSLVPFYFPKTKPRVTSYTDAGRIRQRLDEDAEADEAGPSFEAVEDELRADMAEGHRHNKGAFFVIQKENYIIAKKKKVPTATLR